MRLFELFEAKADKKIPDKTPPRNYYAKAVTRKSGAGPHTTKKYSRKEKYKKEPN